MNIKTIEKFLKKKTNLKMFKSKGETLINLKEN